MWTSRAAETRSLLTDALAQATTMDKLLRVVQRLLVRLTACVQVATVRCLVDRLGSSEAACHLKLVWCHLIDLPVVWWSFAVTGGS